MVMLLQRPIDWQLQFPTVCELLASVRCHRTFCRHSLSGHGKPHWWISDTARCCQGWNLL